jgi:hypothetical protein
MCGVLEMEKSEKYGQQVISSGNVTKVDLAITFDLRMEKILN